MARKSAKAAEARERARERANRFLEREQQLLQIAERFEETRLELEGVDAATEAKVAKIREQAEKKVTEARAQAEDDAADTRDRAEKLQREMLEMGINRREVGERLGVPTRDVVRQKSPKLFMPAQDAEAAARQLAAEHGQITVESRPEQELHVSGSDGSIVTCNVWVDGEERVGELADVDLATEAWQRA